MCDNPIADAALTLCVFGTFSLAAYFHWQHTPGESAMLAAVAYCRHYPSDATHCFQEVPRRATETEAVLRVPLGLYNAHPLGMPNMVTGDVVFVP